MTAGRLATVSDFTAGAGFNFADWIGTTLAVGRPAPFQLAALFVLGIPGNGSGTLDGGCAQRVALAEA